MVTHTNIPGSGRILSGKMQLFSKKVKKLKKIFWFFGKLLYLCIGLRNQPNRPGGFRGQKQSDMEHNYIWVITNHNGEFIKACATRENALAEMKEWRNGCERAGVFDNVSKVDSVYFENISFEVKNHDGTVYKMNARRTILY